MDESKLLNHVNTVLCVWLFFFWRFLFSIFLFLTGLEFRLNSQHVQVYDDIWKLIILYPIDLRIIFSIFLLQPGPPKYSFLATPMVVPQLWYSNFWIKMTHSTPTSYNNHNTPRVTWQGKTWESFNWPILLVANVSPTRQPHHQIYSSPTLSHHSKGHNCNRKNNRN